MFHYLNAVLQKQNKEKINEQLEKEKWQNARKRRIKKYKRK
jgi:hypothetical protein